MAAGSTKAESDCTEVLGRSGALARHIPGFRPRDAQQHMAEAVSHALRSRGRLVVEAGTGTGKTFAYLVPAILSGLRVIASTGTKNLQEQLYFKDLPLVKKALGRPLRTALLKGRGNYLCLHRLDLAEAGGRLRHRERLRELGAIREWSIRTDSGDIAEVPSVREDSPIWPRVTSTADNCLGSECPRYSDCFVVKARRRAQETDLLVINHHLLLADLSLREEGFGEVLPGADAVVIDEAHQLPHVASQFFGASVSARQLQELVRDARSEYLRVAGDMPDLERMLDTLDAAVQRADEAMGQTPFRLSWDEAVHRRAIRGALETLDTALADACGALAEVAERARGLDQCHRRTRALLTTLRLMLEPQQQTPTLDADSPADEEAKDDSVRGDLIRWMEKFGRGFVFRATPMDIAPLFSRVFAQPLAWIFTSATLAVDGRFDHFCDGIGLEDATTLALESPFDYRHNALLWLPQGLPTPDSPDFTHAALRAIRPVIEATRGGVFLLFTSYRALHAAAAWLGSNLSRPLLVQGEQSRGELLQRFREQGDSVLLGTSSFWEGVDVRGSALSLVVIDRLPFSSPGDPVLKARLDALRRRGLSPFTHYQLPQAVIALNQGAGRLIRDYDDRGVLAVCDPRIEQKGYGRVFLNSLPPMAITRDRDRTLSFLQTMSAEA